MNDAISLARTAVTKNTILKTSGISVIYLMLSAWLIGFKSDQVVLILLFNTLYYASSLTRKFILGFSIFIVYWILYDYMKAIPNYLYHPVSIKELYTLEKGFFGISENGVILTPNEYCKIYSKTALDIISGIFYLMWIPVPLAFAAWLFFKNKREYLYFSLTFVLVNFLGFVIYYLYPAAPPWYVQLYGFVFHPDTPGNTGGLLRFDEYFRMPVFQTIYTKGSNVFAAMPSLHSSYPPIVLYYGVRNNLRWRNFFLTIVMLGIWFAAIYSSHHYVLDVIAGIICAITGIVLFNGLKKTKLVNTFIQRMLRLIS
jgi:hypothetical protein